MLNSWLEFIGVSVETIAELTTVLSFNQKQYEQDSTMYNFSTFWFGL